MKTKKSKSMKKFTIFLLLAIFGLSFVNAQVTFQKTFGSPNEDGGYYVQQTTDGGYIVVGYTTNFPIAGSAKDVFLIKTDSNGDIQWSRSYGGTYDQIATCVQQTIDEGYIISGYDNSGTTTRGGFLIKTNSNGDTIWTKSFDGVYTRFNSVIQTNDGCYIVAASSYPNDSPYLVKTDINGNLIWGNKYYPGGYSSNTSGNLFSVQQTSDGNYIACGNCAISGVVSMYLLKVDTAGDILLSKTFSYPSGTSLMANIIHQTIDGGYIMTASYYNGVVNIDLIIKLNANASIAWCKSYLGGVVNSIQEINNVGYVAINSNNYLLKIDTLGNFISSKFYQSPLGSCSLECIKATTDGGFIIVGQMTYDLGNNQDVYLIKTDLNGESNCNDSPYLMSPTVLTLTSASVTSTIVSAVDTGGFFAYVNVPLTNVSTLCITEKISKISDNSENINIYPNPVEDILNLEFQSDEISSSKVELYNLLGQVVLEKDFQAKNDKNTYTLEVRKIPKGIYILKFNIDNNIFIKKVIKE